MQIVTNQHTTVELWEGQKLDGKAAEVDMALGCITKKEVSQTLRSLKVGEEAVFPIEQRTSVRVARGRIAGELLRYNWWCDIEVDENSFEVIVRRTDVRPPKKSYCKS